MAWTVGEAWADIDPYCIEAKYWDFEAGLFRLVSKSHILVRGYTYDINVSQDCVLKSPPGWEYGGYGWNLSQGWNRIVWEKGYRPYPKRGQAIDDSTEFSGYFKTMPSFPQIVTSIDEQFVASAAIQINDIYFEDGYTYNTYTCNHYYHWRWNVDQNQNHIKGIEAVELWLQYGWNDKDAYSYPRAPIVLRRWTGDQITENALLEWNETVTLRGLIPNIEEGDIVPIRLLVVMKGKYFDNAYGIGICLGYHDSWEEYDCPWWHMFDMEGWEAVIAAAPKPVCDFETYYVGSEAPLMVEFYDLSWAPEEYPITSRLWEFGDGTTSTAKDPTHVFMTEGTFSVKLTVTNANGSHSHEEDIVTTGRPTDPVFDPASWVDDKVYLDEVSLPLTMALHVKNQGVGGNFYLYVDVEGRRINLETDRYIGGYETQIITPFYPLAYYLGYTPHDPIAVNFMFYVGAVGQPPAAPLPITIPVVERGENGEEADWSKYLMYGGAAGLIGIGAYMLVRRK